MVEEWLSVLSNYLLDQLRELTSRHTLLILIRYIACAQERAACGGGGAERAIQLSAGSAEGANQLTHSPYSDILAVLRIRQQVVEEGLSVLSNYLLDRLRELTSRHTLLILIYCLCLGAGSRWWRRG